MLRTGPLGHFVLDTEMMVYLARKSKNNRTIYFIANSRIANGTLFTLLKEQIPILRFRRFFFLLRRLLKRISKEYSQEVSTLEDFDFSLLPKVHDSKSIFEPEIGFLDEELEFLQDRFAITESSKVVCLAIRDSGYDQAMGMSLLEMPSFRNTPVEYFKSTIEELNLQGYKVFRLGRHNVDKLVLPRSASYWDLTEIEYENKDKLELAIAFKSHFMLSTGTGAEQIAAIFRKPIFLINLAMSVVVPTRVYKRVLVSDHMTLIGGKLLKIPFETLITEGYFSSYKFVEQIKDKELFILPKNSEDIKKFVFSSINSEEHRFLETLSSRSAMIALFKNGFFVY